LLCRDGYKLIFESNKVGVSKCGLSIGKGYDSGGMLHFSLSDFSSLVVSFINKDGEVSVWHLRSCHINFECIPQLSTLNLIPKLSIVKDSRCQACVQAKQPRKPHFAVEEKKFDNFRTHTF
jgi:hypothetical protein